MIEYHAGGRNKCSRRDLSYNSSGEISETADLYTGRCTLWSRADYETVQGKSYAAVSGMVSTDKGDKTEYKKYIFKATGKFSKTLFY